MAKTLNFKVDGKDYALEFTRETIIATERMGFRIEEVYDTPMSSLTYLWHGAFIKNHPEATYAERESLLERISQRKKGADKDDKDASLLKALIDLYTAPIESLTDEEHEKNAIEWTIN